MRAKEKHLEEAETWQVDPASSTLTFWLRHIVLAQIRGRFARWGGTMTYDAHDPSRSRATVWVDLASIETEEAERDAHIRSPEFLDIGRHPQARFTSAEILVPPDGKPVIKGMLDLHGVQHQVEVVVTEIEKRPDGSDGERLLLAAKARVDRRAFQLRWNQDLDTGGVVVGDIVEITAHVEATRT